MIHLYFAFAGNWNNNGKTLVISCIYTMNIIQRAILWGRASVGMGLEGPWVVFVYVIIAQQFSCRIVCENVISIDLTFPCLGDYNYYNICYIYVRILPKLIADTSQKLFYLGSNVTKYTYWCIISECNVSE